MRNALWIAVAVSLLLCGGCRATGGGGSDDSSNGDADTGTSSDTSSNGDADTGTSSDTSFESDANIGERCELHGPSGCRNSVCSPALGKCVECTSDIYCRGDEVCVDRVCVDRLASVEPSGSVSFSASVGGSQTKSVLVTNESTDQLRVSNLVRENEGDDKQEFFGQSVGDVDLPPGESFEVVVEYRPLNEVGDRGSIDILFFPQEGERQGHMVELTGDVP